MNQEHVLAAAADNREVPVNKKAVAERPVCHSVLPVVIPKDEVLFSL
jgi:hypothetical protein